MVLMPRFEPFRGVRYDTTRFRLADVTAPPYDVLDAAERARYATNPRNIVHLDCPVPNAHDDCYEAAAREMKAWLAAGDLVLDAASCLTGYRMRWREASGRERSTVGVIGALGLEPFGAGDVLPHEHTTPKARSDRLQLLRATEANLSAVWGLSLAPGLTKLVDATESGSISWTNGDGVTHDTWTIDDAAAIAGITDLAGGAPVLIADGHHRYETCLTYAAEHPERAGAQATMAYVVELADDQLDVHAIHRLVAGLPDDFDVVAALARWFEVVEGPGPGALGGIEERMQETGALALVRTGGTALLVPRPGRFDGVPPRDSSRLDAALADFPPHTLTYQHGVDNVVAAVARGDAQAGILLRPVSVDHIADVAHARDRMPPKTTFFSPKPKTGIVLRPL
jgi:uncharacterized protein (DUF1015 family)